MTLAQVIFCDTVPLRLRPRFFSMVLISWSIGSIIGPIVGGILVEHASWRWCFYINFPFCGIGLVAAVYCMRFSAVSHFTLAQKAQRVDWIGAMLFLGSMTSLLIGISWGGVQYPWKSFNTVAPITVGLLGVAAFVMWQLYASPHGKLLPLAALSSRSAIAAFYCALVNGVVVSNSGLGS